MQGQGKPAQKFKFFGKKKKFYRKDNLNKQGSQGQNVWKGSLSDSVIREQKSSPVHSNQMISVVIPLYNEADSLMELSLSLKRMFDDLKCQYEVLLIDDGSNDGSFQKIKEIHQKNSRFHSVRLRRNYGKSSALSTGFKYAKGDIIITMDADLQDDPDEIPELVQMINSGYDLVSGWKKVRYDPFIKRHTSKFFNYVTSKVSGIRLHDFNCGLKAYKKDVIKNIKVYGELHRYIPALAHLSGYKVTEKVVKHRSRKYGVTKFGASRFFNGFFDLMTVLFTTRFIKRPLHLFGTLGLMSFIAGFGVTLYLTVLKLFYNESLSNRPLLLIGIMFIILGVQSFSLGLIGEMITKSSHAEEDIIIQEII